MTRLRVHMLGLETHDFDVEVEVNADQAFALAAIEKALPNHVWYRWLDLDGEWEFSIDADAVWKLPGEPDWSRRIRVPFSPETPASGIGDTGFYPEVSAFDCWQLPRTITRQREGVKFWVSWVST